MIKAIELTEEQKSKLLEMCNKLFSEYKWEFHSNYSAGLLFDECNVDNLIAWKSTGKHSQEHILSIHWFEFCMTHLTEKVMFNKKFNAEKQHNNFVEFSYSVNNYFMNFHLKTHPIDYLYDEFKKLDIRI